MPTVTSVTLGPAPAAAVGVGAASAVRDIAGAAAQLHQLHQSQQPKQPQLHGLGMSSPPCVGQAHHVLPPSSGPVSRLAADARVVNASPGCVAPSVPGMSARSPRMHSDNFEPVRVAPGMADQLPALPSMPQLSPSPTYASASATGAPAPPSVRRKLGRKLAHSPLAKVGYRTVEDAVRLARNRHAIPEELIPSNFPRGPIVCSPRELEAVVNKYTNRPDCPLGGGFKVSRNRFTLENESDRDSPINTFCLRCTCKYNWKHSNNTLQENVQCSWEVKYEKCGDAGWVLVKYSQDKVQDVGTNVAGLATH